MGYLGGQIQNGRGVTGRQWSMTISKLRKKPFANRMKWLKIWYTFNLKDIKASGLYWGAQSLGSITSHSSEKERPPRGEERWPEGLKRTAEMKPMESSLSWRGTSLSFWRQRRPTTTSHETQFIWIAVVSLSQIGLFSLRKRCTHVFYVLRPIIFCSFSDE